MKKTLLFTILMFLFVLSGCGLETKTVPNNGEIKLKIDDVYLEFLDYDSEIVPTYTLEFEGIISTAHRVRNDYERVFSGNDDFKVSKMLENLFNKYKEIEGRFSTQIISTENKKETILNSMELVNGKKEFKKHYLKVFDGKIYNEIAFITLENGLNLTFEYRRFQSMNDSEELITYYAWQYSTSIRMYLHYPLMVYKTESDTKKLLILPLPNRIIYTVGTNIDLSKLVSSDEYITDQAYRSFPYRNYSEDPRDNKINKEEEIQYIKNYYNLYMNGREEDNKYIISYLNKDFHVEFFETSFTLNYIGDTK